MSYRIILIKILEERFLDDFLNGDIYLNTYDYFRTLDNQDQVRSDIHEGIDECWQVESVHIEDRDGNWVPIGGIKNPITYQSQNMSKSNILCLYSYTDRSNDFFDEKNLSFGNVAVIIKDLKEFIYRMKRAAEVIDREIYQGPITYVDESTYNGPMGPFKKFSRLQYQNEFRFWVTGGDGNPCYLKIGDIRDIVMVTPSNTISLIPKIKT